MTVEELYNMPNVLPRPKNDVEVRIAGTHLMEIDKPIGEKILRLYVHAMGAEFAEELRQGGFIVTTGWMRCYEPGWIIKW